MSRGFTLLELMVTIAVAAIIAAIALPSMLSSIAQRQAQSVGSQFVQDAQWTRMQAIAGAASAQITLNPDCSYTVLVSAQPPSVLAAHSMTSAQVASKAPGLSCLGVPAGGLTLSFNDIGMVNTSGNDPDVVTFQSPHGTSSSSKVEIFGSGMMVWNPQNAS